jgi:hypothetical protein
MNAGRAFGCLRASDAIIGRLLSFELSIIHVKIIEQGKEGKDPNITMGIING